MFDSPNTTPSKFIFTDLACGHLHLVPPLPFFITWTSGSCKFAWYYANTSFACSATWWSETACKFNQVLFLWFHTIQVVYANSSSDFPSAISQDNNSFTSINSTSDLKSHTSQSAHTTSNSGQDHNACSDGLIPHSFCYCFGSWNFRIFFSL